MSDEEVTRRQVLSAAAGGGFGFAAAQYLNSDENGFVGPIAGSDTIMPGQLAQTYYYATVEEFENNESVDQYPIAVLTDEGVFVYDAA